MLEGRAVAGNRRSQRYISVPAIRDWLSFSPADRLWANGGANQVLQGRRINIIALTEIGGSGVLGIEAGVEHTFGSFRKAPLKKLSFT